MNHRRWCRSAAATFVMIVAVLLAGCAGGPGGAGGPPGDAPYIEGRITSHSPSEQPPPVTKNCVPPQPRGPDDSVSSNDPPECGTPGPTTATILVEEQPDGNKAHLRLPSGTPIWRETPAGTQRATLADLAEGQTVAAWVSGPVMESFPVQATADAVVIRAP